MSRRIETRLEITNKDAAIMALKAAGVAHEVVGNSIRLISGALSNARIELTTGNVVGDSDYGHTAEKFGVLRQHYSEALIRMDYAKNGTMIDTRSVDKEGNIILEWHMG